MKTKVYLGVLLGMMLMSSCSEDTSAIDGVKNAENQLLAMGLYEGEWRTGTRGDVIGKGNLAVKSDLMEFVLPEEFIVSGFFRNWDERIKEIYPDEPLYVSTSDPVCLGIAQHVSYFWQGTSDNAMYIDLANNSFTEGNADLFNFTSDYGKFSFGITIDETPYRIDITLSEKPTAVYDINTNTWVIMIQYNIISCVNLKTGSNILNYEIYLRSNNTTLVLVFTTTKKII